MWEAYKRKDGFEVRYEELTRDPDRIQDELLLTFDFEYQGKFSDFHNTEPPDTNMRKAINGLRPVDRGHDWREHKERIRDQFTRFPQMFDILIEMGYEEDNNWYERVLAG